MYSTHDYKKVIILFSTISILACSQESKTIDLQNCRQQYAKFKVHFKKINKMGHKIYLYTKRHYATLDNILFLAS